MKDYIISQRKHLYVKDNKIYINGKEQEKLGNLDDEVKEKKIEVYRDFFSRHFDNTIVLTGAGSSYGIGKTDIKEITERAYSCICSRR